MTQNRIVDNKLFRDGRANGFTLVEALIATIILFLCAYMALILYMVTARNATTVEKNIDEQDVIKADLSTIHRISRQFACLTNSDGTANCGCFVDTGVANCTAENLGEYPNEMNFISSDYTINQETQLLISTLCTNGIGGLISSEINNLGNPEILTTLGVARNAISDSNNKHLFHVVWSSSVGLTLHKATFHPTLAAFCP